MAALILRRARCLEASGETVTRDVIVDSGKVRTTLASESAACEIDLEGRLLLPAFVNAHDVLDAATLPPLERRPYASLYEWARADELTGAAQALSVPLPDRLFLGGVRNLLAGVAAVLHHHPDHRSLGRPEFPVRVQRRYAFAHSPGLCRDLRRTYRTSDRRIPWIVRAAEGRAPGLRSEIDALAAANVLRQNTLIVHGTALEPEDAPRLAAAKACLVWCPESDLRLYGRTPRVLAFRSSGVRIGLGSDGAPAGARDYLSSLAVAGRESGLRDAALVSLATQESAEVARLPVGALSDGGPADLLATGSLERLLAGDRRAVALLLVRGRVVFGEAPLVAQARVAAVPVAVEGEPRALVGDTGRRFASLVRRHPRLPAAWLTELAL
jgi:cytosine/adenosine deaminase-related metal-dependent hydrolase